MAGAIERVGSPRTSRLRIWPVRVEPDDHQPLRPKLDRGLDRSVEPRTAVDVPATCATRFGDVDRGEGGRNRGGSTYVVSRQLRRDVVDSSANVVLRGAPPSWKTTLLPVALAVATTAAARRS